MNTLVKVLWVIGVVFVGLFIAFLIIVQQGCSSNHYFAIKAANLKLFRLDDIKLMHDTTFDYKHKPQQVNAYEYNVLHSDSLWNDSAQYGVFVDFDIDYCDDCSSFMDAQAATMPGIYGTRQRIKSIQILLANEDGLVLKDLSEELSADSISNCVRFTACKNRTDFFVRDWGCGDNLFSVAVRPGLIAFRDTFNVNSFIGGVPKLIFCIPRVEVRTFPEQFTLNLKLVFEGGYTVNASARGTRKVQ